MMAGILYLKSENFGIDRISQGDGICNSIKGFSAVLFYSPSKCKYSPYALQEFKRASTGVNGIIFGVVDIDKNMDIVRLSRNTVTPIDGVPYIMLYLDGVPRQIYPEDFQFNSQAIKNFTVSVSTRIIQSNKNITKNKKSSKPSPKPPTTQNTITYQVNLRRKNSAYTPLEMLKSEK